MNLSKSNKKFVSDADRYLQAFNREHPKTLSQLAEIAKHAGVFLKRDAIVAEKQPEDNNIWEDF